MKKNFKLLLFLGLLIQNISLFSQTKKDYYSGLDFSQLKTNVFYNLANNYSEIEKYDGSMTSPVVSPATFKQIYHEINTASLQKGLPEVLSLIETNSKYVGKNIYPIYILDYQYDILREDAFDKNLVSVVNNKLVQNNMENIFEFKNVFVASTISNRTYSGMNIKFSIKKDLYFTNSDKKILYFLVDFDNGKSEVKLNFDEVLNVEYTTEGQKNIAVKAVYSDNSISYSRFEINVKDSGMPWPSYYWTDTADIAYNGEYGVADVAVFLGQSNAALTEPVIIVDGFDPNDERPIEGVYEIANQQNLVDSLRSLGMDGIIINFKDGAGYIQKNAFVFVKILQKINQMMTDAGTMLPENQIVVIGPSMGGLITRYGLDYMEHNGIPHNVRNWISFDSPQKGANIPLGLQHWVRFFADEAEVEGAIEAKAKLNAPAALQMLNYHFTATSGNTANPNSLKPNFYNEIDALGFPQQTRIVSIINGSGYGQTQPFQPGEQVIFYYYRSFEVDLDGHVWAVPNQSLAKIFQGLYDTALPFDEVTEDIYVNNTLPFDGAAGGSASTFADIDATNTGGYGDIIAYYDDHCFIPTISSLALENTTDPLYNVDANINNIVTPFDKIYYPYENQNHVYISPESMNWFIHEVYNFQPQFTSVPVLEVNEDSFYSYNIEFTDENEWNTIDVEILEKPDWLTFDAVNNVLSGTPSNDNVGTSYVKIKISDGLKDNVQEFNINVINTNDAPYSTDTIPDYTFLANNVINIVIPFTIFADDDLGDELTYSTSLLPAWLNFNSDNLTFWGMADVSDTGLYQITLYATDLAGASDSLDFNLTVDYQAANNLTNNLSEYSVNIYPNPTSGIVNIKFNCKNSKEVYIFDAIGKLVYSDFTNQDFKTFNLSSLEKGVYFIHIKNNDKIEVKKLIMD